MTRATWLHARGPLTGAALAILGAAATIGWTAISPRHAVASAGAIALTFFSMTRLTTSRGATFAILALVASPAWLLRSTADTSLPASLAGFSLTMLARSETRAHRDVSAAQR